MLSHIKKTYHRNLLEKKIKENAFLIKEDILDIGSQQRKYDSWFKGKVTACDINPKEELGIEKQNICSMSYPNSCFDSIICFEVLQYLGLEEVKRALFEIKRVLKNGGCALLSLPFYYKDHKDNLRMTKSYLEKILKDIGFNEIEVQKIGNKHTSCYDISRYAFWEKRYYNLFPIFFKYVLIKVFRLEKKEDDYYSGLFIKLKK